uniref:Riboflavin kinase n=1 Tax=Graphocephala atropunctata TaxID=36148 RepID=A0A1B6MDA5_9HEMI
MVLEDFPFFASGKIIKGFGRGSKELGIPTANYSEEVVNSLPVSVTPGIYYGWAQVDSGPVYKMVMSIGWNPYYNNKKKSMETHVIHKFDCDLYGCTLKTVMVGFLRPEKNFNSLDDLVAAINNDIKQASDKLDEPEMQAYKTESFFCVENPNETKRL